MNKVILIGRLGHDPSTKNEVTKFSLATSKKFKKNNELVEKTQWHNIVCFGTLAEITEKYLHKGDKAGIIGEVEYNDYEDKNGVKKRATNIIASEVEFLSEKKDSSYKEKEKTESEPEDENLPF